MTALPVNINININKPHRGSEEDTKRLTSTALLHSREVKRIILHYIRLGNISLAVSRFVVDAQKYN
jgi:hypothetical protein